MEKHNNLAPVPAGQLGGGNIVSLEEITEGLNALGKKIDLLIEAERAKYPKGENGVSLIDLVIKNTFDLQDNNNWAGGKYLKFGIIAELGVVKLPYQH